ncbi:hypothetical protein LZZ85_24535 [Terrimonas sp. NA20]|uniref:DUF6896 domain-containing protein n=1 Tax=Terrimonas ginsenosidimutans TaxID=2908004 RepID=A0ABS9KYN4_9BACT|nr:hypothetical protein [Terrimonas ginsenosidimutans]MCG2617489.1 hypothetical protein [Terrimonas ginsenosidimutans]
MDRTIEIINIYTIEQIPALETIRTIPRERILKLIFAKEVRNWREAIGERLKNELPDFQVGVHLLEPEINIAKLISEIEIENNQYFFEQCAKDYRKLAQTLLFKLVDKFNLKLDEDHPMMTFAELKRGGRSRGKVEGWNYYFHGAHCGFENIRTGQTVEVSLIFGSEFGDLDPYFFSKYIKSTPAYRPLPVEIFEDYADGVRINEKMISLGKFERISYYNGSYHGIVVADR